MYPFFSYRIRPVLRFAAIAGVSLMVIPLSTDRFFVAPFAGVPFEASAAALPSAPPGLDREEMRAMVEYSGLYDVDYRLILAMARHESRFDRSAVSPRGAEGLLQIMPATGRELRRELDLEDLSHPSRHLRAGIYYFAKLNGLFSSAAPGDRIRLALAAYNAGPSRIYDAQELAAWLGDHPDDWEGVRHVLPLLSRRYTSLHEHVWGGERPPHGHFSGWRETVRYVDRVMASYAEYGGNAD